MHQKQLETFLHPFSRFDPCRVTEHRVDSLSQSGSVNRYECKHAKGVESFWAMFKGGCQGTYHQMSAKHLNRYDNEFSGRWESASASKKRRIVVAVGLRSSQSSLTIFRDHQVSKRRWIMIGNVRSLCSKLHGKRVEDFR